MHAIPRHFDSQNWITLLFIGVLLLLVFARNFYPAKFYNFRQLLVSNKYFTESFKSTQLFGTFSYALFFAQDILISLGIYFSMLGLNLSTDNSFVLFIKIFLVYTVFILGKYLLERIIGSLFSIERFLDRYVFYKITYKNFIGICLFPLLLILNYVWKGTLPFYGITLILFFLLNFIFLGVYYKKKQQQISINLFYFILYLCTFEIAPYYILYKVVA